MVQDSLFCLLVVDPIACILCSLASWMRLCSFNVQILFLSFALNHGRSHWFKFSTVYHETFKGAGPNGSAPCIFGRHDIWNEQARGLYESREGNQILPPQ